MKIYLGTDHAGFYVKETVKDFLQLAGYEVIDMGATTYDENDDYPDFILAAAEGTSKSLAAGYEARGIVFGGSGQGEALAANKVPGIRAALYYGYNLDIVKLSRKHNNSNVLALGSRMVTEIEAKEAIQLWLNTEFDGDRHQRRIEKITAYENKKEG